MKLNYNLKYSVLFIFFLALSSCDDNESGVDLIDFEARFVSDIQNRTVSFNNLSVGAASYLWDFGDGTSSTLLNPVKTYADDGAYTVTLTANSDNGQTSSFQDEIVVDLVLVVNGDFEEGSSPWIQGVDDNAPAPVVTENGNSFYEVNITNPNPSQPFLVNLSQKLPIEQGRTYVLTFDAWSDQNRTLIAGIGMSGPSDFSNDVETIELTDTQQTFTLTLSSQEFGGATGRVLFDSNGDAGLVRIDNVSLALE